MLQRYYRYETTQLVVPVSSTCEIPVSRLQTRNANDATGLRARYSLISNMEGYALYSLRNARFVESISELGISQSHLSNVTLSRRCVSSISAEYAIVFEQLTSTDSLQTDLECTRRVNHRFIINTLFTRLFANRANGLALVAS